MLVFQLDALFRNENPSREDFEAVLDSIHEQRVFSYSPRLFFPETREIARFVLSKFKSLAGHVVYQMIEAVDHGFYVSRRGYELHVNKEIEQIYEMNNKNILEGLVRKPYPV